MVLVVLASCSARTGAPEAERPKLAADAQAPTTIWDGVYTADQAARGEQAAWANCFSCHLADEWGDPAFMRSPPSWRLGDLFNNIRRSMPYDTPGSLSADEYADILAYMLKLQGAPEGDMELPNALGDLDRILVTPREAS